MKTTLPSLAVAIAVGCTTFAAPAVAQTASTTQTALDDGGRQRIENSRKLRMLSQLVPAAACHLKADIDPGASYNLLIQAISQVDATLNALEFGDAALGVPGAEPRRKTVASIQAVRDAWIPFRGAAEAMLAGDTSDENMQLLVDQNAAVLEVAGHLAIEMAGHYSNPNEMVQADSFLIDIAGRQRMFIQKISKDSCLMLTNTGTPETSEQLQSSIQSFDVSLGALRNGMPSAGLRPPPTPAIAAGLDKVLVEWRAMQPMLEGIIGGSELDDADVTRKFHDINMIMTTMNEVVAMYVLAIEH